MDALVWKRIGELFAAVRELEADDRLKFLMHECGDNPDLVQQIQSLLDADAHSGVLDPASTVSNLRVPELVAGRFRIDRYIAEGGMGTVYEAYDLQLHERVALKTIRAEVASNANAVARFKHEIHVGKSITHPNVCRIHDLVVHRSDSGVELLFLSMQFLDGQTLSHRIRRGTIPFGEALPLIEDLADGLTAAHEAGVIHRDFKSGNVMLVKGTNRIHAIITDFGLARAASDDSLGSSRRVVGTLDYMAPEQIKGELLTPAADIYSFGVVIYEMVTGRRPFTGDTKIIVAVKQLQEDPRPPRELASDLDSNWNEVILRCLRKSPSERPQFAAEVKRTLLTNVETTGVTIRRKRIAIGAIILSLALTVLSVSKMPELKRVSKALTSWVSGKTSASSQVHSVLVTDPVNQTGDPLLDYSVRELLNTMLEQSPPLRLYPAALIPDVLRRMNLPVNRPITQELGLEICRREGIEVAVVVTISRFGAGFTLVVKAITPQGEIVASNIQTAADIGRVPEAVENAATSIRRKLGESSASLLTYSTPLDKVTSTSLQAVQTYSEGKARLYEGDTEGAVRLFERALELDPQFAMAREYLGVSYAGLNDADRQRQNYLLATHLADRVTERERLKILGDYDVLIRDYDKAISYFRAMITIYPSDGPSHINLAQSYLGKYLFDQALAETNIGLRLQPGVGPQSNLAELYFLSGNTIESLRITRTILSAHPEDLRALYNLGRCSAAAGDAAAAREAFERLVRLGGAHESQGRVGLADLSLAEGRFTEAQTHLRQGIVLDKTLGNRFAANAKTLLLADSFRAQGGLGSLTNAIAQLDTRDHDPVFIFLTGSILARAGNVVQARRYLHMFDSIEDQFHTPVAYSCARLLRSEVAMAEGDNGTAVEAAQEAIGFDRSTLAVQTMARAHEHSGAYTDSIREYEEVLSRSNERMETYDGPAYHEVVEAEFRIGLLYDKIGNKKKTREHLYKFLRQWNHADPNAPNYKEARRRAEGLGNDDAGAKPTPEM